MNRIKILFNKPVYVGQAILDISKTRMYDFHYNYVKKKWKNTKLCFTDTDSLLYMIETDDLFEDISADIASNFDTSDYPKDYQKVVDGTIAIMNKKVPGLMKDEVAGKQITKFIGLRPKCYAFKTADEEKKSCKGIKIVEKKKMSFEDWERCLRTQEPMMRQMTCFRSKKHTVSTIVLNKVALSTDDDKVVIQDDKISTCPWGFGAHGKTREEVSSVKQDKIFWKDPEEFENVLEMTKKEEWAENRLQKMRRKLDRLKDGISFMTLKELQYKFNLPREVVMDEWKQRGLKYQSLELHSSS